MNLKFHTRVEKGLELKGRKFYGLVPTFVGVTWEKLVRGGGLFVPPSPILNRVNGQTGNIRHTEFAQDSHCS